MTDTKKTRSTRFTDDHSRSQGNNPFWNSAAIAGHRASWLGSLSLKTANDASPTVGSSVYTEAIGTTNVKRSFQAKIENKALGGLSVLRNGLNELRSALCEDSATSPDDDYDLCMPVGEELSLSSAAELEKTEESAPVLYGTAEELRVIATQALKEYADDGSWTLRKECLHLHSDVLRVGHLCLNGEILSWRTDTTSEQQLSDFHKAFMVGLGKIPGLALLDTFDFQDIPYMFCKAVALTYMPIADIMHRVGASKIETHGRAGVEMEYRATIADTLSVLIDVTWNEQDNLFTTDVDRGDVRVKGKINRVSTYFPLPLDSKFVPMYNFRLQRCGAAVVEHDFTIVLDRTASASLGAVLVSDGASLRVEELIVCGGGCMHTWNHANPELQVLQHDTLVEVNGICGDADAMIEELSKRQKLDVKVLRGRMDLKSKMSGHVKTVSQMTAYLSDDLWRKTKEGLMKFSQEEQDGQEQYLPQRYDFRGVSATETHSRVVQESNGAAAAFFTIGSDDEGEEDGFWSKPKASPK